MYQLTIKDIEKIKKACAEYVDSIMSQKPETGQALWKDRNEVEQALDDVSCDALMEFLSDYNEIYDQELVNEFMDVRGDAALKLWEYLDEKGLIES